MSFNTLVRMSLLFFLLLISSLLSQASSQNAQRRRLEQMAEDVTMLQSKMEKNGIRKLDGNDIRSLRALADSYFKPKQSTTKPSQKEQNRMSRLEVYLNDVADSYLGWMEAFMTPKKILLEQLQKEFDESGTMNPESMAKIAETKAKIFARMNQKRHYNDAMKDLL
mmetsp:Transcript_2095/g.3209  ORF Transcript_2095/g.3209 Transcript_2095/m.3209 type:complete len:166 (+) Transcript_2095:30-527(+)